MKPVCKYYLNSECTNPRCRYAHPVEFPMYIYTFPGIEIHPDELRLGVCQNSEMAYEADNVWISNYVTFCKMRSEEGGINIVQSPDYFCMPFDPKRIRSEVERLKNSGQLEPTPQTAAPPQRHTDEAATWGASWQNPRFRGYQPYRQQYHQNQGGYQAYGDRYNNPRHNNRNRRYPPNEQEFGWYSGPQSYSASQPPQTGSFDRASYGPSPATTPDSPAAPRPRQNDSPEYDYRNIPYDYNK